MKSSQVGSKAAMKKSAENVRKMELSTAQLLKKSQEKNSGAGGREGVAQSSTISKTFRDTLNVNSPVPPPVSSLDYQKLARPSANVQVQLPARPQMMGSFHGSIAQERWPRAPSNIGTSTYGASNFGSLNNQSGIINEPAAYQEGTVFAAPFHQHDFNQPEVPQNKDQSMTGAGIVNTKIRKFVVVHRLPRSVIALPIYTHEGRGLEKKSEKNEFVSIREVDFKDSAAQAESDNGIIWADAFPSFKRSDQRSSWFLMSDKTSVLLTHPHPHYLYQKATICGQLLPESAARLDELYRRWHFDEENTLSAAAPAIKELFPSSRATLQPPQRDNRDFVTGNRAAESTDWLSSRSRAQARGTPSDIYAPRRYI